MDTTVMTSVLIGILEVAKKTGFNPKFIPVLSLILGSLMGVVYSGFDLKEGVLYGVSIGLDPVRLYSGGTNLYEGVKHKLIS